MRTVLRLLNEIRPEFDFSTSDNFIEDGMLDSLDIVTLVAAIDKEFNISIPGTQIVPENFRTASAISSLIQRSGGTL
jgi:acyl carrier protein